MVLAESSAWIDYLRDTSDVADAFESSLRSQALLTTDPVIMEVLAGARSPVEEERLSALLGTAQRLPCERADYVEAARIHRACRERGATVRGMLGCLIAAVAIRADVPLLHADRDFETIARCSGLELA
jgi:predicted nucleic acid-binding protein